MMELSLTSHDRKNYHALMLIHKRFFYWDPGAIYAIVPLVFFRLVLIESKTSYQARRLPDEAALEIASVVAPEKFVAPGYFGPSAATNGKKNCFISFQVPLRLSLRAPLQFGLNLIYTVHLTFIPITTKIC